MKPLTVPATADAVGDVTAAASIRDNQVTGRRLVATLGFAAGLAAAAGVATAGLLRVLAPSWADGEHLGAVISAEVYLIIIVAHVIAFGGLAGLRDRLRLGPLRARDLGLAFILWVVCWAAALLVHLTAGALVGPVDELGDAVRFIGSDAGRLTAAGPVLFALAAVRAFLLTPLAEELLFRGSLYGWLRRRLNATVTIALTAAVFAVMHAMPGLLVITTVFGIAAAWVRERTGSLTPFLVIHVLNNALMITFSYLVGGWR